MATFNTTPLSYTGAEFSDSEKAQFAVDWDLYGESNANKSDVDWTARNLNATSQIQINDTSINIAGTLSNVAYLNQVNAFSTRQDINFNSNTSDYGLRVSCSGTSADGINVITTANTSNNGFVWNQGGLDLVNMYSNTSNLGFITINGGYQIGGTTVIDASRNINANSGVFSGTVTAAGYLPFTGIHIAKSDEELQIGELVQIESDGWLSGKQPDWKASYCTESTKGVYGIVYNIEVVDITEKQEVEIEEEVTETKERIVIIDGEETIETYEETKLVKKIVEKDVKIGEKTEYHIASTGDAFCYTDCAVEYGDFLVPSKEKGKVTVYKGDYMPLNYIGKAGETKLEAGKIAWTKE